LSQAPAGEPVDLERLIYRDELTGLYNRRYFRENFERFGQTARADGSPLCLLFIDVDHFKSVNDRYGHDEGDRVLTRVARAMEAHTPEGGHAIRFAGDEFLVALPGFSKTRAVEVANQVLEAVRREPITTASGEQLRQTLSIGVAGFPDDSQEPESLRELADEAAYLSKKKGRNTVSTLDDKQPENLDPTRLFKYFPCRRFVGRGALTDELRLGLSAAPGVQRPYLLLAGPRGIGRTRLLAELARAADPQRTHLLSARCSPYMVGQPFAELAQALRQLFEADPERIAALAELDSSMLAGLAPLVPALVQFGLVQPGPVPALPAPRLVVAMGRVLAALARERPLILLVDDFQWSSRGTRMALDSARAAGAEDMAVILAWSPDLAVEEQRTEIQAWANPSQGLETRELPPLDATGMGQMLEAILAGLGARQDLLGLVEQVSAGRPLMVEGLLRFLVHAGRLRLEDGRLHLDLPTRADLPEDLEQILLPATAGAESSTSKILARAAVLGDRFDVESLTRFSGLSEAEVVDALEQARRAGLVSAAPGEDSFVFWQPAHEAAYRGLSEEEARDLHAAAARMLEQGPRGSTESNLASLAWQWERAAQPERSQDYLERLTRNYQDLVSPVVVEAYIGKLPVAKDWGVETPLDGSWTTTALRVVRLLRVSLQNLARFPSGSDLVRGSLETLHGGLRTLFEHTEVVSLEEAEGALLVNGSALPQKDAQAAGAGELAGILQAAALRGISLRSGATREELESFLSLICTRPADLEARGGWNALLRSRGITRILTSERIYLTVGEKELDQLKGRPLSVATPEKAEPAPGSEEPPPTDLRQALEAELKRLGAADSAREDLKGLLEQLVALLERMPTEPPPAPAGPPAEVAPLTEGSQQIRAAMNRLDLVAMARLEEHVDVLLEDLRSTEDSTSQAAAIALLAKGPEVLQPVLQSLRNEPDVRRRKVLFHVLRKLDPQIERILLEDLATGLPGSEAGRILETLDDLAGLDLGRWLPFLVTHPDPDTRRSVLDLVARRPSDRTMHQLLDLVPQATLETRTDLVDCLGKARYRGAVETLCTMLRSRWGTPSEQEQKLQRAACTALGHIGDPAALPTLQRALQRFPLWFLNFDKPASVRAAAAMALARFPGHGIEAVLERRAAKDSSSEVRAAARLALSRLRGQEPDRSSAPQPVLGPGRDQA